MLVEYILLIIGQLISYGVKMQKLKIELVVLNQKELLDPTAAKDEEYCRHCCTGELETNPAPLDDLESLWDLADSGWKPRAA